MQKEEFFLWLYITGIITFLIIFPLWIINVRQHYKELKRDKALNPFVVLIKQLTIVNLLLSIFSILPIKFLSINKLKGRQVWIEWDIRWWVFGSTLAEIEEILRMQKGFTLLLKLNNPIKINFGSENIEIKEVLFRPYNYAPNLIQYCLGSIAGRLLAHKDVAEIKKLMKSECVATCKIVVY
jgi:hypothetical protein